MVARSTDGISAIFPRGVKRHQRGDMLIESLVAMAMVGIIAVGPAYIASRAAVAQAHTNVHTDAAGKLRGLIHQSGTNLCTTAPGPISVASQSLAVTATCTDFSPGAVTVGGVDVALSGSRVEKKVSLSVTSAALFGGSGTIAVSE